MRKIKFRGRRIDTGEFIYGDLLTGGKEFAIINYTLRAMVADEIETASLEFKVKEE